MSRELIEKMRAQVEWQVRQRARCRLLGARAVSEKLDEMEQTFAEASGIHLFGKIEDGLRAVLEAHVKPLLAEAFARGIVRGKHGPSVLTPFEYGQQEAARIISDLTKEPKP